MIVWLCAVLGVQFVPGWGLLAIVAGVVATAPHAVRPAFAYIRRARWLLLSLWLILAFNTPGEAFHDLAWAPTHEGIADANLQAARLLVMLACLAWLFEQVGRDGMVGGLWGVMGPFRRLGLDVDRLVVRLALVLGYLQEAPEKGAWRRMLTADPPAVAGGGTVSLATGRWHRRDSLVIGLAAILLLWAVMA